MTRRVASRFLARVAPLAILSTLLLVGLAAAADVHVIQIHGVINPVSSRMISDGIADADEADASAIVIELDTPGGLLKSVHEISKNILGSPVPVIVHVAPEGARATSAGVLVTISAHVAAMAQGTHIGAAHVVTAQGSIQDSVVNQKAMNDWVAELQSVARLRDRNEEWVTLMARESKSLVAEDALTEGVVDIVESDLAKVLTAIDGRQVEVAGITTTLDTDGAEIIRIQPSFRDRFLSVVSDPSVAYILFMIGIYGLIFELSNPGSLFPGIAGAICIILALYSLHSLPVNYAGVALILLAIVMFIAETQVPSFGLLTLGGIAALVFGSIMLLDKAGPLFQISLWVIFPAAIMTAAFFSIAVTAALKAQRRTAQTGQQGLIGETGLAQTDIAPRGKVFLHGEIWNASSSDDVHEGDTVRVVRVDGMMLEVAVVERASRDDV